VFSVDSHPYGLESAMTDRKTPDELPERRSDRAMPLNVESVLVDGARKKKEFNPDEENEELKKDTSDTDTIRGDLETPEPVPPKNPKPA
jgi:hypothetical protein